MALAALGSGILSGVGPTDCVVRGLIAMVVGIFCTQLWYVFFTIQVKEPKSMSNTPAPTPQSTDGLSPRAD